MRHISLRGLQVQLFFQGRNFHPPKDLGSYYVDLTFTFFGVHLTEEEEGGGEREDNRNTFRGKA